MQIKLTPKQVPTELRGTYTGRKFKAEVCETMIIPADAGLWDGGSKDSYTGIDLETGKQAVFPGETLVPWDEHRSDKVVIMHPGFAVVRHTIFCGKDLGLTYYIHPENAGKFLPAE